MKKYIAILLMMIIALSFSAVAEDLGVQVIGGEAAAMETLTLDDMKLEQEYKINGYASVAPKTFEFVNMFAQYNKGNAGANETEYQFNGKYSYVYTGDAGYFYKNMSWQDSGNNADFAMLKVDITNLSKEANKFIEQSSVKVVYDDDYEFGGWIRQINYDFNKRTVYYDWTEMGPATISPDDEVEIDMMYTGTYVFGCTLPTAVIEGKEPLRMEITLGDNELTYHIRK